MTESPNSTVVLLSEADTFGGKYDRWSTGKPGDSGVPVAFLTGFERTKTTIAFERDYQPTAVATVLHGADHAKNLLGDAASSSESDTHQLRRDWRAGWQLIDTPRSQVAQGFFGGAELRTSDITFRPTNAFAVIAVASLTDAPIAQSPRLFITAMGPSRRVEGREENYRSQCLGGTVVLRFKTRPSAVAVIPVQGDGRRSPPIPLTPSRDGTITINLAAEKTHWWIVETRFAS